MVIPSGRSVSLVSTGTDVFPAHLSGPCNVQVFTSSGTYTPTPGARCMLVDVWGAGGGGGGAVGLAASVAVAGGGGAGSYVRAMFNYTQATTVTIGAGGTAGSTAGGDGGTGGDTSFGALISTKGGVGGTGDPSPGTTPKAVLGGVGGAVGTVDVSGITISADLASDGGTGIQINNAIGCAGSGAGAVRGGAPTAGRSAGSGGENGRGPGAGGAGAISTSVTSRAGGIGSSGKVVVYEFY